MSWTSIKMPSNGGDILKLESGKAYRVRIVGEPYVFQSEFNGDLSTRYAMTIWNQDEKAAQILLLPGGAFRDILGYAQNEDDWGNPEDYDFIIKKTGSGLETRYTIQPSPKKVPLQDDEKAQVASVDLADVLAKLPSVTMAYKASEAGESPFPATHTTTGQNAAPAAPTRPTGVDIARQARDSYKVDTVHPVQDDGDINLDSIPF